jgi:DNA-binding NtrC family response regulator
VDVRLIAASNKDLQSMIAESRFREDLFYRLNVIPIHLPPLRNRKDDIPLLVTHFVKRYAEKENKNVTSVSPEALKIFTGYQWPGNVRELENVIERAVILTNHNTIIPDDLPQVLRDSLKRGATEMPENLEEKTLEEVEKHYILKTLEKFQWNQKQASDTLGISTTTLWRKLKSYGIEPKKKE